MAKRCKRKAFGVKKKMACDLHHCKKKSKGLSYKAASTQTEVKHMRVRPLKKIAG